MQLTSSCSCSSFVCTLIHVTHILPMQAIVLPTSQTVRRCCQGFFPKRAIDKILFGKAICMAFLRRQPLLCWPLECWPIIDQTNGKYLLQKAFLERGERLPWYTRVGHACECVCMSAFVCVWVCVCVRACVYILDAFMYARWYGVATISGLHKIIGPFCERAL